MRQFIHMVKPAKDKARGTDGKTIYLRISDSLVSKVIYFLTNQGYRLRYTDRVRHTFSAGEKWSEFEIRRIANANELASTSISIEDALKDLKWIA